MTTKRGFWERNRASGGYLLRARAGSAAYKIFRAALLFGLCFMIIQPLLNKVSVSFMAERDYYDSTVSAVPRHFTLGTYKLVDELIGYKSALLRTTVISGLVAALQVTSCTLAGYGFARFNFPFRKVWFACVILAIVVPTQTILAPLYLNFRFFDLFGVVSLIRGAPLNLLDNPAGLMLLAASGMGLKSGLYIFMLRQYFRGVPKELDEAAFVDGCGKLRTFTSIMLPDAMPMITSCFLFSFVWQWTDSLYTSMFLPSQRVLSYALSGLAESFRSYYDSIYHIGPSIAYVQAVNATGMLAVLLPLIALYLFAQRMFVESLSQTGIKM